MEIFNELTNLLILSGVVLCIPYLATLLVPERAALRSATETHAIDARGRYSIFDVLRGIAILAVILIHVTYFLLPNNKDIPELLLNALNASMRFTIPLFLIVSGILLKPPARTQQGLWRFYRDKFVRIGIPYVIVSVIIALYYQSSLVEFVRGLFVGTDVSLPFYYIAVLFQLYLIYPLIEPWAQKRWFVYTSLGLTLATQLYPIGWTIFGVYTFFQYAFFFVWGIYLRKDIIEHGRIRFDLGPWFILIALYALLFFIYPAHYYNIRPYFGLGMFMILYVLISQCSSATLLYKIISNLGRNSLWIFLVHFFCMELLFQQILRLEYLTGYPLLLASIALSVSISLAVAYSLSFLYTHVTKFFGRKQQAL